jgi:hypothetical protein
MVSHENTATARFPQTLRYSRRFGSESPLRPSAGSVEYVASAEGVFSERIEKKESIKRRPRTT